MKEIININVNVKSSCSRTHTNVNIDENSELGELSTSIASTLIFSISYLKKKKRTKSGFLSSFHEKNFLLPSVDNLEDVSLLVVAWHSLRS